jgi:uncharacterized protein (DUF1501 family)
MTGHPPNRRHFLKHLAGASSLALPAWMLTGTLRAHAQQLGKDRKAAILIWLGGGPSSIDMWDMKPGMPTGGAFRPINTSGDLQICEHLPRLAQQMHRLALVRSMSTREADHTRGRYYMHTGYVPSPNVQHPSYGAVVAHELAAQRRQLQIPPFVAIGGNSVGPGFLGMTWSPFVVQSDGAVRNLKAQVGNARFQDRMATLGMIEQGFNRQRRGQAARDHTDVISKSVEMMTSDQLAAFDVEREPEKLRARYGTGRFGRGCLLARRLVEAGVPFVEVDFGGWDNHQNIFPTLKDNRLPVLDQGFSALIDDLVDRGLWEHTVVFCMGEFGRTPRINADGGRDHFARAWSVALGGGGISGGQAIGATGEDGTQVTSDAYSSEDLMASVCHALGISLKKTFTSRNGRPMRIAGGGSVIRPLFA